MPGSDSKDIEPEGRYLESLISINVRRPMGELDDRGAPELDSERVRDSVFGRARRLRSLPSALIHQPGTRVASKTNAWIGAFPLFPLYTAVFPMTLVGAPMLFNCGAAMHNSDAACLHKTNCYKLAVQQNPYQACRCTPVKRDTQIGFIHGNCARPASFDWKLRSRSFAPSLVRFCRVTAVNGKTHQNHQK